MRSFDVKMRTPVPTNVQPVDYAAPSTLSECSPTCVRNALIGICSVALLLRLAAIIALRSWTSPSAMEHDTIARAMMLGWGFAFNDWGVIQHTSVQSPLFPYLLFAGFKLFGTGSPFAYGAIMLFNAVLGAASCALTYACVRALRGPARVGLLAAALVAIWPTQIYAATFVQAIVFITFCTLGVIWLWYRAVDTQRMGPWIGYGVVGCAGALTEPVLLPFMALSGLLILAWRTLPMSIRLRNAAVLLACAGLIIGPWAVRNYFVHGAIVPVKSTFWVNVWKGNNPYATGTDRLAISPEQIKALRAGLTDEQLRSDTFDVERQYNRLSPEQRTELWGKPEVEREKIFAKYAKTFIHDHPGRYVELCGIRLWKTLWVEADNPKAHGLRQYVMYWAPRTLLLALTPIGLIVAWWRGWRMLIPALVVGSALLTYTLTITAARFALPYEPLQLGVICMAIVAIVDRNRADRPIV